MSKIESNYPIYPDLFQFRMATASIPGTFLFIEKRTPRSPPYLSS